MCDEQRQCEQPRALAYDSARQRRFDYFRTSKSDAKIFRECASHCEASRRGYLANVGSKFRKRSPLITSVLFNRYSTNAADGYLSA
ncbi:hypothetical protein ACVW1A_001526 [Bradyrhizobium sp. LB1.3]|uniref:hypothetical protein n=1 Tax=unclassified Bradyrhizobium TaxID=2631580 RepID=UPI001FF78125|nr:hypothetical protein [Bradyrhizobium sp. 197]MCK1480127.1 hypothetical protein [Bradyrhizobium sp. 197]